MLYIAELLTVPYQFRLLSATDVCIVNKQAHHPLTVTTLTSCLVLIYAACEEAINCVVSQGQKGATTSTKPQLRLLGMTPSHVSD